MLLKYSLDAAMTLLAKRKERSIVPRMYYITTAIDYTNGPPHIGHAYEKSLRTFSRAGTG